jgi:hypothetical protein
MGDLKGKKVHVYKILTKEYKKYGTKNWLPINNYNI